MAIINVGLVTKALKRLVEEFVKSSSAWGGTQPTISVLPPDKLQEGSLGIYLYHVSEDPHFKNQPPVGTFTDQVPVRYTPMALNLFYLLTTDAKVDTDNKMLDAQLLVGLALKSLHDFPVLTDGTVVNGVNIFQDVGIDQTDTKLKISMQPIVQSEAVNYWTAGQSPLRLSAYYNVSVVLLEPEQPPTRAARVLDYGIHTFVRGAPRLTGSKSVLTVTLPGAADTQEIELQPAEVAYGNRFELMGVNLASDDTRLVLSAKHWSTPVAADLAWGVIATDDRVIAEAQQQADGQDIVPGVYTAKVQTSERRTMPDGSVRTLQNTSNETPFIISPRIDTVGSPDISGNLVVTGLRFQNAEIKPEDVQVFLSAQALQSGTAGSLNPGEYAVVDDSQLQIRLPANVSPGFVPFRLIINGAESSPAWIEVT